MGQTTTYGWGAMENLKSQGIPIPRLYGKRKVAGNIIARHIDIVGNDQYLNLLMGLAEGPVNNITNIEINGQPIDNYSDIWYDTRVGTLNQTPIEYFGDTFNTTSYNIQLTTSWLVKQTSGSAVEGLRVEVNFPAGLYAINDDGDVISASVTISIQYKKAEDSTWIDDGNKTITSSSRGQVRKAYDIRNLSPGRYDVRIRRTSGPQGIKVADTVYLAGIGEIVTDDFSYPTLALLGVRIKATAQLSNTQPAITCDIERPYTAVWDGSQWVAKPTSNPAWAAYDILVRPIYECDANGSNLDVKEVEGADPSRVIYADFEDWADYCESKGLEFNMVYDSQMNLWDALAEVSQVGRGTVIMRGTKFSCILDRPSEVSQLFSDANMVADSFKIDYLKQEDRANVIEVSYFDKDRDYQRESFLVFGNGYTEDGEVRKTQMTLHGCTDYEQAWKEADYRLKCNQYLLKTVSFGADIDAIACQVGDVIAVQSYVPVWGYGGRVVDATANAVVLDQEVTMSGSSTYVISVRHQDDTIETRIVKRAVSLTTESGELLITEDGENLFWDYDTTSPLTSDILILESDWHQIPQRFDVFSFGVRDSQYKKFKVTNITRDQDLRRTITAVEYNESLYVEGTPVTLSETALSPYPVAIRLEATESLVAGPGGTWQSSVHVTWQKDPNSMDGSWRVYRKDLSVDGASWEFLGATDDPGFTSTQEWQRLHEYRIAVVGVSDLTGKYPSPDNVNYVNITTLWKQAAPGDVENFRVSQEGLKLIFTWDHITDVDRNGYEIREGPSWEGGTPIVKEVSANAYVHYATYDGTYTYWIKAIDTSGNYSVNATSVTVNVSGIENAINIVYSKEEIADFKAGIASSSHVTDNLIFIHSGNTVGLHVPHALVDVGSGVSTWTDSGTSLTEYSGTTKLTGYYISPIRDIGANVQSTLRLLKEYDSEIKRVTDLTYPSRTDLTYPNDTDITVTSAAEIYTLYRFSDTSPLTSLSWSTYTTPVAGTFRYFQRKDSFALDSVYTTLSYTSLQSYVDVPDKLYTFENQSIGASGTTFSLSSDFGLTFLMGYVVACSVLTDSYYYSIKNKSLDEFYVTLFDSSGTSQAGAVDILIKGF